MGGTRNDVRVHAGRRGGETTSKTEGLETRSRDQIPSEPMSMSIRYTRRHYCVNRRSTTPPELTIYYH